MIIVIELQRVSGRRRCRRRLPMRRIRRVGDARERSGRGLPRLTLFGGGRLSKRIIGDERLHRTRRRTILNSGKVMIGGRRDKRR